MDMPSLSTILRKTEYRGGGAGSTRGVNFTLKGARREGLDRELEGGWTVVKAGTRGGLDSSYCRWGLGCDRGLDRGYVGITKGLGTDELETSYGLIRGCIETPSK